MGVVFGLLTSLSIGMSDLFGRRVVNARGPIVAGTTMQFVAIVTSFVAVALVPSTFGWSDIGVGLLSGLGLGLGLVAYFGGLVRSSSAVVAPLVGTLSAVVPYVYAVVRGSSPTAIAVVGAVVALCGLVLVTLGGGRSEHIADGVRWGVMSGLAYGFGLSVAVEASDASGSWPAAAQRISAFLLMLVVARAMRLDPRPPSDLRPFAIVAGVFAGLSTVFFLLGLEVDPTAAVVAGSMFPAVTVVVGRFVYHDDVVPRQILGIGVVIVGVIGVALG